MQFLDSARLFFRGPLWKAAGALSGVLTAVAIADTLAASSRSPWMWLFFGALGLVVAAFYSFHRGRMEMEAKREALPSKIDELQREGIDLIGELRTPVQPERKNGLTTIYGEWAPDEWWEKVEAFEQEIRDLLLARYPALLSDYAEGFNGHLRKRREEEQEAPADPADDKRSNAEKMLAFANGMRSGPAKRMEASLAGLTAVRHRVGSQPLSN